MPTIFVKVLTLASFFFVFIIFVSLLGVYSATHPRKRGVDITPESLGMGYENISFQTRDGLTLRGWFIPSKTNRTIVVLHGYPFNKGNILDFAKFLHPLFQLFLFDFRAMGESDGKIATGGLKEQDDLKSALAFLRARKDVGEIGVYGFSYGASIALLAAPQEKGIKAIVADSGFSSLKRINERMFPYGVLKWPFVMSSEYIAKWFYGIDTAEVAPAERVGEIRVPIFFIHGKADSQIPYRDSQELYERANEPKELWLIEGADHGNMPNESRKEYENKVRDFFYKNLK
jgi:fermentation-respiration switch protein FrsA (DUF1100 family)